jgi:hypothetical protein
LNNFEKNIKKTQTKKNNTEEYNIKINYGIADMNKNSDIKQLYERFETEKNISTAQSNHKLFFIINNSNEKFLFKRFDNSKEMNDYISSLDNSDFFEDISFSVLFINIV